MSCFMKSRSGWKVVLLLVAILFATNRPAIQGNGWLYPRQAGPASESDSGEERGEGERESEKDEDVGSEGRKTRRTVNFVRIAADIARGVAYPPVAPTVARPGNWIVPPAGEHAFRFGIGTPLRI